MCVYVCVYMCVCLKHDKLFLKNSGNAELKLFKAAIKKNKPGRFVLQVSRCITTLQQLRKCGVGSRINKLASGIEVTAETGPHTYDLFIYDTSNKTAVQRGNEDDFNKCCWAEGISTC